MPKKKAVTRPTGKKVAPKKVAKKKVVRKLATARNSKPKPVGKRVAKVAEGPKTETSARSGGPSAAPRSIDSTKSGPTLGRPLVTQEEKLYMLFHDDYQCRQVFEFLRVETIKELEEFSPQQIVHLMSRPIRMTVDRIRQRLAQFKRSLKDDEQYAASLRVAKPGEAPVSR